MLPLADWRIVRLRTMYINGSSRRDSNLLAHERTRLYARCTAFIWAAPTYSPLDYSAPHLARSHSPSMTGKEAGLAAERRRGLFGWPWLLRRQRFQRMMCQ